MVYLEIFDDNTLQASKALGIVPIDLENAHIGKNWYDLEPAGPKSIGQGRILVGIDAKLNASRPPTLNEVFNSFRSADPGGSGFISVMAAEKIQRRHGIYGSMQQIVDIAVHNRICLADLLRISRIHYRHTSVPCLMFTDSMFYSSFR